MHRRRFLVGLGGITVGLPLLRKFIDPTQARAGELDSQPKRIISVAHSMGTIRPLFTPTATGKDFEFGPLTESLEPFRGRTMLITNIPNAILDFAGRPGGHPIKKESVFTGTLTTNAFSGDGSSHVDNVIVGAGTAGVDQQPNGPSVDHVIGQALAQPHHLRPSVDLGVVAQPQSENTRASRFFYEAASNPVTLVSHPGQAFAATFARVTAGGEAIDEALLALRHRRKSVLDGVRESFVHVRQGLDARDRAILDDHADKIRQIELDLPDNSACTIPDDIDNPGADMQAYYEAGYTMAEFFPLQARIMAHAMACDVAPVGRLEFGRMQQPVFGIPIVDDAIAAAGGWHSPIVHQAQGWSSEDPARVAGFRFFVDSLAQLLAELAAVEEGPDGQTLLDNSLVVFGSDLGDDNHFARDMCFAVCGGSEQANWGTHIDGQSNNTNQLLTTLLQLAGVEDDSGKTPQEFGLLGFTSGPIAEMLVS